MDDDGLFEKLEIYVLIHNKNYEILCNYDVECKELEYISASSPRYSFYYSNYVTKKRFKLGEEIMKKDEYFNRLYKEHVQV